MCYYIKTLYFNDPLFKETDATYILHLEGNGRYQNIEEQLQKYHPTKIVHILFNKGYKKCEKPGINTPPVDLVDAYKYVLNHSLKYNTILILEDDFFFHKNVKNHTENIDAFVETHKNLDFVYRIGCIPYIQFPYNMHNYVGISIGSHSSFYSKSMRDKLVKATRIYDWDIYLFFKTLTYIYYTPVCYQLFPATDNQKHWGIHNTLIYILGKIFIIFLQLLKLDTQAEPGYSILYGISKLWIFLILFLIITKLKKKII